MEEKEQYSLKEELERTLAGEAAEALRDRDSVEEKAEGSRDKAPVLSLQEEIEREDALSSVSYTHLSPFTRKVPRRKSISFRLYWISTRFLINSSLSRICPGRREMAIFKYSVGAPKP